MRSFITCTPCQTHRNYIDQVEEDEMGRACSITGQEEECI
jgi:hypothetical protein